MLCLVRGYRIQYADGTDEWIAPTSYGPIEDVIFRRQHCTKAVAAVEILFIGGDRLTVKAHELNKLFQRR